MNASVALTDDEQQFVNAFRSLTLEGQVYLRHCASQLVVERASDGRVIANPVSCLEMARAEVAMAKDGARAR